ncbi:ATP-binding cassette domain-containing protein, partial [Chryseobacterium scophthalmum]
KDIEINNMSFRYIGSDVPVFENLNLNIPHQKTTAIVGASGSGKTTLLKLLMKFYEPNEGEIKIGNTQMKNISPRFWRDQCGVVMQEGYVFNDTIANNIAVGEDYVDKSKLRKAVEIANIKEF